MENLKKREQTFAKVIQTNKLMLQFVLKEKIGVLYTLIKIALSVFNTLVSLVSVFIPGLIIDELISNQRTGRLILLICVLAVTPIVSYFIDKYVNLYLLKISNQAQIKYQVRFYDYLLDMDYETIESPETQRLRRRAQSVVSYSFGFIDILEGFFTAFLRILAMLSVIIKLNPLIIFMVLCSVIINFVVNKKVNYSNYLLSKEKDKCDDYKDYIMYVMESFKWAKDIRLFGLKHFFIKKYTDGQIEHDKLDYKASKKSYISKTATTLTSSIQLLLLYIYLIYQVINRGLTVGGLTIYMNTVNQLSSSLNSIIESYLNMSLKSLDVQDYYEFINIPKKQKNKTNTVPVLNEDSVIEFKGVCFRYPGSERDVIKDLNIKILLNEKLCIVGENGAGKSTFIKLLTRLYYPSKGEILLDGININDFNQYEYQKLFSPIFQDYSLFPLSLEENIKLSCDEDEEKMTEVCEKSRIASLVKKLSKGLDTQVGKGIDPEGFEPSGGEGQRIAIARALYHERNIFLLDEPTAALDPNAEYEMYTQFHDMVKDKCAVVITHRLSAVQLADKVAVFDDGQVIEYGTHTELYSQGGKYKEMFDKQAEFYVKVPNE